VGRLREDRRGGGIYCAPEEVRARPGASGRRSLPNTEVRIVDGASRGVEPGAVGEMIMRGETMMKAYWRNPGATAETVQDGWVHTGDLARIDADGYITLVDRLKDLIITGGRNVYSVEVERALAGYPGILEVAVYGFCDTPPNQVFCDQLPPDCCNRTRSSPYHDILGCRRQPLP